MNQLEQMVLKAKVAYKDVAGYNPKEAEIAGNAYVDAIDDMMEGAYYMLRTLGPQGGTIWTTKKGHKIDAQVEAA